MLTWLAGWVLIGLGWFALLASNNDSAAVTCFVGALIVFAIAVKR